MSDQYTITTAIQGRSYPNKHQAGENLVVWRVGLENAQSSAPDGLFELHKKEGNEPKAGDVLEVERKQQGEFQGEPFVRLFLAKPQNPGGGYTGGSRQSDGPGLQWRSAPFERGAEHPRNEVRMIHTSALSAAVPFINQMVAFGLVDAPKDEDAYWTLVGHVAGRLTKSYEAPLSATLPPPEAQQTLNGGGGEVPADTREMAPAGVATSSDDDIPFARPRIPDRETRRRDLFIGDRAF